jgi:hypothetical protein
MIVKKEKLLDMDKKLVKLDYRRVLQPFPKMEILTNFGQKI